MPGESPDDVVLDIDASLHEIHSENKAGTAPHYKGGFGFAPLYCTADANGEVLGVALRPGNADANNIADHVEVLDQAIAGLPEVIAAGHRAATTRAWSDGKCGYGPTRPGAPRSFTGAANATSDPP